MSQIWQHNVRYINIIEMKNVVMLKKSKEKEKLSESIVDTIALVDIA